MALTKEQIEALSIPFSEAAIKAGFEKIAQSAGQPKPTYIVSNAETMEQYKQLLADSAVNYTKQQIEDAVFQKNIADKVQAQLEYAQKNWPQFSELEGLITEILKQWPGASLEKAYQKALELKAKEEKYKANLSKIYWTPIDQQGNLVVSGSEMQVPLSFKKAPFVSDHDLKVTTAPGYWAATVPASASAKISKPAPQPAPPMWNMTQTIPLLKKLQPESRKYGYHVCMGGGVLNNWSSNKDLDLYYLPMNNEGKAKPKELIHYLAGLWGKPEPIGKSADYPHDALPYIAKLKFEFTGEDDVKRRIDLFVMGAEAFDVHDCLNSLSVALPTSFMAKIIHRKRSPKS